MKIILSGYNVDTEVIEALKANSPPREDITPETISAAYARISRDSRSVDELRKIAREEVGKARTSNQKIIFEMGHHSVAEHAVFNFDVIGVSRFAIEQLEKFRLCSYTEKSQRYQKLEDDYIIPDEIKGGEFEKEFIETIKAQNTFYHKAFEILNEHVFKTNKELAQYPKNKKLLEGWAKEDARYATSLATHGQLGMTINARNLELLFRRFASQPLNEVKVLGKKMYELVQKIAPSIILFSQANDLDSKTYADLKQNVDKLMPTNKKEEIDEIKLVDFTPEADEKLVAVLMHAASGKSYENCLSQSNKLSEQEKLSIVKAAMKNMEFYDATLREFEHINLTFELIMSAACFGQLKRHRTATITCQEYDPKYGVTVPNAIIETGLEDEFRKIVELSEKIYHKIYKKLPHIAPYILTNSHSKRVLLTCNLREFYHISRLREDKHAQWDIRFLTSKMRVLAQKAMPLSMLLVGGKDKYVEVYKSVFSKNPKVLPPIES